MPYPGFFLYYYESQRYPNILADPVSHLHNPEDRQKITHNAIIFVDRPNTIL
jgi:hypothetical protein